MVILALPQLFQISPTQWKKERKEMGDRHFLAIQTVVAGQSNVACTACTARRATRRANWPPQTPRNPEGTLKSQLKATQMLCVAVCLYIQCSIWYRKYSTDSQYSTLADYFNAVSTDRIETGRNARRVRHGGARTVTCWVDHDGYGDPRIYCTLVHSV